MLESDIKAAIQAASMARDYVLAVDLILQHNLSHLCIVCTTQLDGWSVGKEQRVVNGRVWHWRLLPEDSVLLPIWQATEPTQHNDITSARFLTCHNCSPVFITSVMDRTLDSRVREYMTARKLDNTMNDFVAAVYPAGDK